MTNSFAPPRTVAHQAPLSMGLPRQEHWSGLSLPSPGDLPNPGIKPKSPVSSLPLSHQGSPSRGELLSISPLLTYNETFSSVQFSSVAQSCLTLCDPMNRSTPGRPVHHHLPEFTQTHVHRVRDAIQPSHPLSSPSPPAPNPSQHQSLFQ